MTKKELEEALKDAKDMIDTLQRAYTLLIKDYMLFDTDSSFERLYTFYIKEVSKNMKEKVEC